jgi:hypothetical protein
VFVFDPVSMQCNFMLEFIDPGSKGSLTCWKIYSLVIFQIFQQARMTISVKKGLAKPALALINMVSILSACSQSICK